MKFNTECLNSLQQSQIQVSPSDFIPFLTELEQKYKIKPEELLTMEQIAEKNSEYRKELVKFFTDSIKSVVEALNFPMLRSISFGIVQSDPDFKVKLSKKPSVDELHVRITDIQGHLNNLNDSKMEITHYLVLFQHALNALESFNKPLTSLFESEDYIPTRFFGTKVSKQSTLNLLLAQLESPVKQLKQYIKDLNSFLENVLAAQNNTLLRTESSIRTLLTTSTCIVSPNPYAKQSNNAASNQYSAFNSVGLDEI